jgi:hypothetical protein
MDNSSAIKNSIQRFEDLMDIPKDPFETLANTHGYSLKKGDILVLPEAALKEFTRAGVLGVIPEGVKFSPYVESVILIGKEYLDGLVPAFNFTPIK